MYNIECLAQLKLMINEKIMEIDSVLAKYSSTNYMNFYFSGKKEAFQQVLRLFDCDISTYYLLNKEEIDNV